MNGPAPTEEPAPASRSGQFEVTIDGFIPGEDVVVAPILAHGCAGPDGRARSPIELAGPFIAAEVVVFGRVSGTIHIVTRC